MEALTCPLCRGNATHYHTQKQREFFQCVQCQSVFLNPAHYISTEAEIAHYKKHNNDPEDIRYQNFVSPITNAVLNDFGPLHSGLDFGSGTGSPIFKVLNDNNYNILQYDLFFHNNKNLLTTQYDYIACSETAEHFKNPYEEFVQLRGLLKPGGTLYLMTDRFDESRDFANWSYKSDPTHIFLYHKNAFEWIREEFGFSTVSFEKRMVTLRT